MYCTQCGEEVKAGQAICISCGFAVKEEKSERFSTFAIAGLTLATLLFGIVGLVVGFANVKNPERKTFSIFLLVFGLLSFIWDLFLWF